MCDMQNQSVDGLNYKSCTDFELSDVSTELGLGDVDEDVLDEYTCLPNLFIFDWDDTICPTSWLQEEGLMTEAGLNLTFTEAQKASLRALAEAAEKTLLAAVCLGRVVIVTNAKLGWVELSCEVFMPSLRALIARIAVISARSLYEQHDIFAPNVWKCRAINDQVKDFSACHLGEQLSVISVGDALYEQDAASWAVQDDPSCYGKTLKFEERPNIDKLIEELSLVADNWQYIVSCQGDLDLEVGVEQ